MTLAAISLFAFLLVGLQIAVEYHTWRARGVVYRLISVWIATTLTAGIAAYHNNSGAYCVAIGVAALNLILGWLAAHGQFTARTGNDPTDDDHTDTSGFE